MKIEVRIQNVYGRDVIYPVCETARKFAQLAGQKTLTTREIQLIKDLGYRVEVIQETKEL